MLDARCGEIVARSPAQNSVKHLLEEIPWRVVAMDPVSSIQHRYQAGTVGRPFVVEPLSGRPIAYASSVSSVTASD